MARHSGKSAKKAARATMAVSGHGKGVLRHKGPRHKTRETTRA